MAQARAFWSTRRWLIGIVRLETVLLSVAERPEWRAEGQADRDT